MKLVVLGLSGALLLTGCSSSPSITAEDQVKLLEYENCLTMRRTAWLDSLSNYYGQDFRNRVVTNKLQEDDYLDYLSNPKWVLDLCKNFRP